MSREIEKQCHWKIRFLIAIIILGLSFVGLAVSDLRQDGAWNYWRVMVPVFALLSLFLSWFLRRRKKIMTPTTIWHELVQWLGLALAVYLVSIFVDIGLIGRFEAGLVVLTMLALNIFITGIYIEPTKVDPNVKTKKPIFLVTLLFIFLHYPKIDARWQGRPSAPKSSARSAHSENDLLLTLS